MYHFLDRHLNEVNGSVKYVLWGIRAWTDAVARNQCPKQQLKNGFCGPSGQATFQYLHLLLGIFQRSAIRQIKISVLKCYRIGEDEALLLAALSALEQGNQQPAKAVFSDMLSPAEARHALGVAIQLVDRLVIDGHRIGARTNLSNCKRGDFGKA